MDYYSKPYNSIGGFQCVMNYWLSFSYLPKKSMHEKKFGYWNIYYDGYFHMFSIYPFRIDWGKMPITVDRYKAIKNKHK